MFTRSIRAPFLSVHPSVSSVLCIQTPNVLAGCRFRTMRYSMILLLLLLYPVYNIFIGIVFVFAFGEGEKWKTARWSGFCVLYLCVSGLFFFRHTTLILCVCVRCTCVCVFVYTYIYIHRVNVAKTFTSCVVSSRCLSYIVRRPFEKTLGNLVNTYTCAFTQLLLLYYFTTIK